LAVSSSRRARPRLIALGGALGLGLLAAGTGALVASARLSEAPPSVAVGSLPATTVVLAAGGGAPPTTVAVTLAPDDTSTTATTAAPSASSAPATVPPVALTGEFGPFDQSLHSAFIGNGALAISVAVAKDGELVHTAAFGVANPMTGEAVSPAHRFRVASNSKLLTATAVLELVEDGNLGLDEPVLGPLVSGLGVTPTDPGISAITLRQLLSHTSGFPEYQRTFFGGGAANCEEAARRGLGGALLAPPGIVYRYSNMNFCLIGLLIEAVTGRPYETVIQEDVLAPLGISDMRMAGTYDVRPGDVVHPTTPGRTFMEALGGAGAWIGTASDLVTIVDCLDRTRPGWHPLSEFMVAQMQLPQAGILYSNGQWYGLGLRVWADGTWGHTGTVENARSMVIRRPDGITWAVTISGNAPSNTDRIRKYVDEAFATIGIAAPPVTAALPPTPASAPTTAPTTATPTT
jgi:D-alanyl-D-alanine carboxypeptidase